MNKKNYTESKTHECLAKATMSLKQIENILSKKLNDLKAKGTLKGEEKVIAGIREAKDVFGPRYFLAGHGQKEFLRMNSNSYLGLHLNEEVITG